MRLEKTLILIFISLNLLSFNSNSDEISDKVSSCLAALDKGDAAAAQQAAEVALKRNAKNRDALLCDGRALSAQGRYDEALKILTQGEQQSKTSFEDLVANLLIGNLHKANNHYAEALTSYEKSLALSKTEKTINLSVSVKTCWARLLRFLVT
jgi:tetratricopeptide (TPR) repeat protein